MASDSSQSSIAERVSIPKGGVPLFDPLYVIGTNPGYVIVALCLIPALLTYASFCISDPTLLSSSYFFCMCFLHMAGSAFFVFLVCMTLPQRPVNALYLRSFRNDSETLSIRTAIASALGPQFRLSGIRDPRRRVSPILRSLHIFAFCARYNTPKYMNLEAGDDWLDRLRCTLETIDIVFIDTADITTHLQSEIDIVNKVFAPDRVVVIAHDDATAATLQTVVGEQCATMERMNTCRNHVLVWDGNDTALRQSFASTIFDISTSHPSVGQRQPKVRVKCPEERVLWQGVLVASLFVPAIFWIAEALGFSYVFIAAMCVYTVWSLFLHVLHGGLIRYYRPGHITSKEAFGRGVLIVSCGLLAAISYTLIPFALVFLFAILHSGSWIARLVLIVAHFGGMVHACVAMIGKSGGTHADSSSQMWMLCRCAVFLIMVVCLLRPEVTQYLDVVARRRDAR